MEFSPTPQQTAIFSAILSGDNVMVTALAGCGKTSTIVAAANKLSEEFPTKRGLALAFNKKIKDELAGRLPPTCEAITMNALGHRAWGAAISKKLMLDSKKQFALLDKVLEEKKLTLTFNEKGIICKLCDALRNIGAIPPGIPTGTPLVEWNEALSKSWDFIDEPDDPDSNQIVAMLLTKSIQTGFQGSVDFMDQLYLPVVFGASWPTRDFIFVDEAQDLSPMNHIMVKKCKTPQLIVVGDPNQAIYAFRGAMSDSMDQFRALRNFTDLSLTVTFRCGKSIVDRARGHVPNFTAAESNPEGEVIDLGPWDFASTIIPGTAILCRNNAPLIRMALRLLRARIAATIIGRDIAAGLVKDIKKAVVSNLNIKGTLTAVKAYYDNRVELKPSLAQTMGDRYAAILAAGEGASDRDSLCVLITSLFTDDPTSIVTLSTGHKAKGLEWERVIHLDPQLVPFRGSTGEELVQELNLRYVIETRAKETLMLARSDMLDAEKA